MLRCLRIRVPDVNMMCNDLKRRLKLSESGQNKNRPGGHQKSVFGGRRKLRRSGSAPRWKSFVRMRKHDEDATGKRAPSPGGRGCRTAH
jgi:hypothetical protein